MGRKHDRGNGNHSIGDHKSDQEWGWWRVGWRWLGGLGWGCGGYLG